MENSVEIPEKLEIELPYDPAISLLGKHTEETRIERDVCPNVHRSTVYNSQDMETTSMSIDGWMDKEDVVYIYNGIILSHKKEWIWVKCSEVDETRACFTE